MEVDKMEKLTGKISKLIWAGDNHSVIISVIPDGGKQFVAIGTVENAKKGATVTMHGDWEFSQKMNQMQFKIKNSYVEIDAKEAAAIQFLSSGAFKGIGEATACQIVSTLGSDLYSYMLDAKKLMKVPKISESKANGFTLSFKENGKYFVPFIITGGEITLNQAKKIFDKYGTDTEQTLKNNPYLLVYDIDSFGFHKADKIALKSGHKYDGKERIFAGMVCALKNAAQNSGHCFLYESELLRDATELLLPITQMSSIFYQDVLNTAIPGNMADWRDTALADLITNHSTVVNNIVQKWNDRKSIDAYEKKYSFTSDEMDTLRIYVEKKLGFEDMMRNILKSDACYLDGVPLKEALITLYQQENRDSYLISDTDSYGIRRFYERRTYLIEHTVADDMRTILQKQPSIIVEDNFIKNIISEYENNSQTSLGHEQKLAVACSLKNRISIITGGPGRGKTTIEKVIIDGWTKKGGDVLLLAPTGRAAQRMSEATGAFAMTIHRALLAIRTRRVEEEASTGKPLTELIKDDNKTLVIIDESSMIDMNLVSTTLKVFSKCHLLFIGDAEQLPCVGIGDFFENIISSGIVPCTRLIECYRNSGSISHNSDVILNGGRIKDLMNDHMFKTVLCKEAEVCQTNIVLLYQRALKEYDKKDICIIVPLRQNRKTSANELNKLIQEKFNPKNSLKKEVKSGASVFRVGDRVMQTKNNYQLSGTKGIKKITGVFNGETGEIMDINDDTVKVLFDDGKIVFYNSLDISQLTLAYATTVHKAQGSEYPCVIMAFTDGDYMLLCRKIIYTAASRGKKIVYLVGSPSAIQKAISNSVYEKRNTALSERMLKLSN